MKKAMVMLAAVFVVLAAAGAVFAADITGKWVAYQEEDASRGEKLDFEEMNLPESMRMNVTFNADGTTPRPTQNGDDKVYTYKVEGDTVTTYDEDGVADEVYTLVGDELTITVNGTRVISFRKASE
jgi:Na+-translocating ferredoxin:NAD+ oxidoreductase RnfG subunit